MVDVSRSQDATTDLFEAIYSLRAIRRWKPDPVPAEIIWNVIEAGTMAPNGGNRQQWAFVVVTDPDRRAQIGDWVRERTEAAGRLQELRDELAASPEPSRKRIVASALNLFQNYGSAPVIVFPCLYFADGAPVTGMAGGSIIYPAVQNILLAARGYGLGTTLTSIHRLFDPELRALCGIPENARAVAAIPMGYPGAWFGPLKRQSVEQVTHWDRWGDTRSR